MNEVTKTKPGYKKTKLGWIPKKWTVKKLSNICKITSGGTPNRKTPEYWNGDIPWITTSLIDFNKLYSADEFITKEGLSNSSAKLFDPGTILIALYGQGVTRGKSALLKIKATTNQACAALISQKDVQSDFLFQLLIFHYRRMRWISNDGSQKNLSSKLLKNYQIPLPPLPEQKKIAEIFSTWDRAIETLEQLIAKKEELKKGLMQQLLTVNENSEWQKAELRELGSFTKGKGISKSETLEEGIPAVRYGELYTDHHVVIKKFKSFIQQTSAEKSQRIQHGDILFAGSGETAEEIGKCAVFVDNFEAYAGGDIVIFRPQKTNPVYLSYFLNSTDGIRQKSKLGQGHSVVHIYSSHLKRIKVSLPNRARQDKVVELLTTYEKSIEKLKKQKQNFEVQKKGLMQQLLTGKTRVNYE